MSSDSYRNILRYSLVAGGASIITILSGLVKLKLAAYFLGPAGVGLVGIYQSLIQVFASVGGGGISTAGIRKVSGAMALGDLQQVARSYWALTWGTLIQAILSGCLLFLIAPLIGKHFVEVQISTATYAFLGLGITLSIVSSSQLAILTGLRRIGDIAYFQIFGSLSGTLLCALLLWTWKSQGVLAIVLIPLITTCMIAQYRLLSMQIPGLLGQDLLVIYREWLNLARLGIPLMVSGLVTVLASLALRIMIQQKLGIEPLGYFQASWAICSMYLGVALGAMSTDYYPRLTSIISDSCLSSKLVNEQTEISLIICGPIIILAITFSPWLINLLYSQDFGPTVGILRWQLVADVLKVTSWPLAYIMLAKGYGKSYFLSETVAALALLSFTYFSLVPLGIESIGLAYCFMYASYLWTVWILARRYVNFAWSKSVKIHALLYIILSCASAFLAELSSILGFLLGVAITTFISIYSLKRLAMLVSNSEGNPLYARLKSAFKA